MKEWSMEKFQPLVQSFKRCTQFSSKAVRAQKSDPEEKLRAFAKMVQEGNIKNATRFLADENGTSALKPSDVIDGRIVIEILQEKHPKASPLFEGTFNISELPPLEKLNIVPLKNKPGNFSVVQDPLDQTPTTGLMRLLGLASKAPG